MVDNSLPAKTGLTLLLLSAVGSQGSELGEGVAEVTDSTAHATGSATRLVPFFL